MHRRARAWEPRTATGSLTLVLFLAVHPFSAQAQSSTADPPEEESACEPADLHGAAWGLCNAYCEAMDCDGDDPQASDRACERVLESWEKHADGLRIPCEPVECPCWISAEALVSVHAANRPQPTTPRFSTFGRPAYRFCFEDPDTSVIGLTDSIARNGITSIVSPVEASCATEVHLFGGDVIPVLRADDLTEGELRACSQIIREICP